MLSGAQIEITASHLPPDPLLQRRRLPEHLERSLAGERAADRLEGQLEERVRTQAGDLLHQGLDQRPGKRRCADADLPARAHADRPLDQQPRVLVDPRIAHDLSFSHAAPV